MHGGGLPPGSQAVDFRGRTVFARGMADEIFPVFIQARLSNGSVERVRVGSAEKGPDGFLLKLGEMVVGMQAEPSRAATAAVKRPAGADETVFPPYGRSKGQPVYGATMGDLEYYAGGCRRTLGDPSKSRWHEKERVLLATIEAEMARQGGGASGGSSPAASSGGYEEPPPMTDDDIPF